MRFLIDNALSPRLAQLLCEASHEAVHVRELAMQAAQDVHILQTARDQDRVLVSADSDFATILALQQISKPSFVLFREADLVLAEHYARRMLVSMPLIEAELRRGCVVVFRRRHIRIRDLPISSP